MTDHADTLRKILTDARAAGYMVDTSVPLDLLESTIAALAAGRSGEPFVGVVCPECNADYYASAKLAAAPQQPPPVGVTDATKRDTIRKLNYQLWMDGNGGCEPPQDWQDGYIAALSHQQPAPSVSEDEQRKFDCDVAVLGVGFMVDGKRVSPERVTVEYAKSIPIAPAPVPSPAYTKAADPPHTIGSVEDAHLLIPGETSSKLGDAESGEGLHAALCFLGELESVGNAKAGEIARGLRRITTTGQGDVERLVEAALEARDLQREHYGDGCGLHLAMIDWARKYEAPFGQQQEGQG